MFSKEYYIYQVNFLEDTQLSLPLQIAEYFDNILLDIIKSKPSTSIKENDKWVIGNVNIFSNLLGGYFRFGKISKKITEEYDDISGDFNDAMNDEAIYTIVIFDCENNLLGIAKKSDLSSDVNSISKKLEILFQESNVAKKSMKNITINEIKDPDDFLDKLRGAYKIRSLKIKFNNNNSLVSDELSDNISDYCNQMAAEKGTLEVTGNSINLKHIESIIKYSMNSNNEISAKIIPQKNENQITIYMRSQILTINISEDVESQAILDKIKYAYSMINQNSYI